MAGDKGLSDSLTRINWHSAAANDIGDDDHFFFCFVCGNDAGALLLCEGCPHVVHHRCSSVKPARGFAFLCAVCSSLGKSFTQSSRRRYRAVLSPSSGSVQALASSVLRFVADRQASLFKPLQVDAGSVFRQIEDTEAELDEGIEDQLVSMFYKHPPNARFTIPRDPPLRVASLLLQPPPTLLPAISDRGVDGLFPEKTSGGSAASAPASGDASAAADHKRSRRSSAGFSSGAAVVSARSDTSTSAAGDSRGLPLLGAAMREQRSGVSQLCIPFFAHDVPAAVLNDRLRLAQPAGSGAAVVPPATANASSVLTSDTSVATSSAFPSEASDGASQTTLRRAFAELLLSSSSDIAPLVPATRLVTELHRTSCASMSGALKPKKVVTKARKSDGLYGLCRSQLIIMMLL